MTQLLPHTHSGRSYGRHNEPTLADTVPPVATRIVIVGCGHVGLIMAAGFAKLGHQVVGIDRNRDLVARLSRGEVALHEVGLHDLVADGLRLGRLSFSSSYDDAIAHADVIFLAVDTPRTASGAANLRNIRSAVRSIATALNGSSPIIVNKSTSPIGTGETIEGILRSQLGPQIGELRIVSNPEFLRQGRAVQDFFEPDRIVVGARSDADARTVAALYRSPDVPVLVTDLRTAEMIKYVANSFLATRVSFINEIARLCDALGVDVDRVIEGVSHDERIGRTYLSPGIGFGGTCLPKDVAALRFIGESLGVPTPMLSAIEQVNLAQKASVVRRLRARLGTLDGRRIAVWGLTFKAHTEDVRESPAVDVVNLLANEGAEIIAYDPKANRAGLDAIPIVRVATPLEAVHDADALLILTEWPEFGEVPLTEVSAAMRGDLVLDGRNILSRHVVEEAGLTYVGVGRGHRVHNRRRGD